MRNLANHYDEYSKNLRKEPSGLRGFSERNIKILYLDEKNTISFYS